MRCALQNFLTDRALYLSVWTFPIHSRLFNNVGLSFLGLSDPIICLQQWLTRCPWKTLSLMLDLDRNGRREGPPSLVWKGASVLSAVSLWGASEWTCKDSPSWETKQDLTMGFIWLWALSLTLFLENSGNSGWEFISMCKMLTLES